VPLREDLYLVLLSFYFCLFLSLGGSVGGGGWDSKSCDYSVKKKCPAMVMILESLKNRMRFV